MVNNDKFNFINIKNFFFKLLIYSSMKININIYQIKINILFPYIHILIMNKYFKY